MSDSGTARQAMLAQLAGALAALGEKLRTQQQAAVDLCALGARAEEVARTARGLAFDRRLPGEERLRGLSDELQDFAAAMQAAADQVERDTLLGRSVAAALGRHAEDLNALSRLRAEAADLQEVRARLRPLLETLDGLPQQMKANRERTAEVTALAARAGQLALRAGRLAAGGLPGRQDQVIALSRELGRLAEDAVEVSARFSADAAVGVEVAEQMAGRARDLSTGSANGLARILEAGHAMAQSAPDAPAPRYDWAAAMPFLPGSRRR
ncbi:hypothetical protein [Paracraurococcus lichenis]|uniref:Methyl-accepting chemotaxis protein n=1 Tax=Paracraurococcus lichenis TaxID=3064888 RepID=A0ABT9E7M9_9PROT|nr:hypothetical protein [Paracraurococcus sp. LOR1-02]MDO9711960.1 hypothetical protein [Paracraurococcus sp. LOR1-02]